MRYDDDDDGGGVVVVVELMFTNYLENYSVLCRNPMAKTFLNDIA
jgi:hypothetical protein